MLCSDGNMFLRDEVIMLASGIRHYAGSVYARGLLGHSQLGFLYSHAQSVWKIFVTTSTLWPQALINDRCFYQRRPQLLAS